MRDSARRKPSNQYVISVQLDKESFEKMHRLIKASGMSKSHLFRVLIAGAKLNISSSVTSERSAPAK